MDNVEATIHIGQRVPVVEGVSVNAVGSANPNVRYDDAGLLLKVRPHINPDGLVVLDVVAEKSEYQTAPGTGVVIFTDATNGNVIEAPIKDLITAESSVNVKSGQTVVLGGLITTENVNFDRKVPWLGDLPYLGAAFRYNHERKQRKELLIILTPEIVSNDKVNEQLKREEIGRMHFPISTASQMHGPIFNSDSWDESQGSDTGHSQEFPEYEDFDPYTPVPNKSPLPSALEDR